MFTARFIGRFKKCEKVEVDHDSGLDINLEVVDIDFSECKEMPEFRHEDF